MPAAAEVVEVEEVEEVEEQPTLAEVEGARRILALPNEGALDSLENAKVEAEALIERAKRVGIRYEDDEPTEESVEAEGLASQALALRSGSVPATTAIPTVHEWEGLRAMAQEICTTEFVPRDFRGRPEAVLASILVGRELGIGPMQSLRDISILDGRPALAAHLQLAQLRRGGVKVLESASTSERAWIRAQRRDTGETAEVEWTFAEAETITYRKKGGSTAKLVEKDNWKNYPADMLWARAVGRLTRRLGSDLIAGLPYTAEEAADFDDDNGTGPGYETGYQPRRVEPDGTVEAPKSWAALAEAFDAIGVQPEWITEAVRKVHNVERVSEIPPEQKEGFGQKLRGAYLYLREQKNFHPSELPPPARSDIQEAFAKFLEGVVLDGPEWSLSPQEAEAGRRQRWEVKGEPPPEPPDAVKADAARREAEAANEPAGDPHIENPEPVAGPAPEQAEDAEWTEAVAAAEAEAQDAPFGDSTEPPEAA